jgi:hypothetical protein
MKAFGSGFVVLSWCCCGMSVVALWYDTRIPQSHRMNILGTYIRAVHVRKDHGPFGGPFVVSNPTTQPTSRDFQASCLGKKNRTCDIVVWNISPPDEPPKHKKFNLAKLQSEQSQ